MQIRLALLATLALSAVAFAADLAARVNGIEIEQDEVQELVRGLARAESSPPDTARIEELMRSAVESLIDLELLYQEAVRTKVPLGDGEVDREVEALQRHFASEEEFEKALGKRGMTLSGLRIDTRRTLLANRLLQRTVWRGLSVSSEEIEAFYSDNEDKLDKSLEQLQDSIALMLLDEKKVAARAKLVAELRSKAKIERYPPFGSDTPATPAQTPAS